VHIPIKRRRFKAPLIGEPIEMDTGSTKNFFLDPVRRVWESWQNPNTKEAQADQQADPGQAPS